MLHAPRNTARTPFLRALAGAVLASWLFTGSTCHTKYCSESCNPCVSVCQCSTCSHATSDDPAELFGLSRYVLVVDTGEDGAWTRSYRSIVGPSVSRAFGVEASSRRAFELFARNVVLTNARLFGPLEAWSLADVERSDAGVLVRFERVGDAAGELVMLLDAGGRLLEIAHHGRL